MRQRRSEVTRARILEVARRLFLEKGMGATSIAEICRESGVSNGAVFHQFAAKEDIAFTVYSQVRVEFWSGVIDAMVACDDALDGVEAAVRAAFAHQREQVGAANFMSDVAGSGWIANYADAALPDYDRLLQRGLAWAMPHIAAGRLAPITPDVFIGLVAGAPQWLSRMSRIGMVRTPIEAMDAEMAAFIRRAMSV